MDSPVHTHPRRKRGADVSLARRHATVVEIAPAIPLANKRPPKGTLGLLALRYGVDPEYPTTLWKSSKAQIDETQELALSNKPRGRRPSLFMPTKAAALRAVNKQNWTYIDKHASV